MIMQRLFNQANDKRQAHKRPASIIPTLFISLTLIYCNHAAALSTKNAMAVFQQDTRAIVERSHKLSKQHAQQMELLSQQLDNTQSAKIVLQSEFIGDMTQTAEQMLALANQYLPHYQHFLANIDKDSHCYQPEQLAQFQQTKAELQDYVDNIDSLLTTRDEAEAFSALMAFNLGQTQVNMVVDMFEMSKFCYLSEALPSLVKDVQTLETDMTEMLISEKSMAQDEAQEGLDSQSYGAPQQQFATPPAPDHELTATIENQTESESLFPQQTISYSIDKLSFNDAQIESCIKKTAAQQQLTNSDQLTLLNCRLSADLLVNLDDLQKFEQLQTLSLTGGKLADLSPLSNIEVLYLQDNQIEAFGNLDQVTASISFSNIRTQDWQALAQSRAESISIMKPSDCTALKSLALQPNIAMIYKGLTPSEMMKLMQQGDGEHLTIMTDCPVPQG